MYSPYGYYKEDVKILEELGVKKKNHVSSLIGQHRV